MKICFKWGCILAFTCTWYYRIGCFETIHAMRRLFVFRCAVCGPSGKRLVGRDRVISYRRCPLSIIHRSLDAALSCAGPSSGAVHHALVHCVLVHVLVYFVQKGYSVIGTPWGKQVWMIASAQRINGRRLQYLQVEVTRKADVVRERS